MPARPLPWLLLATVLAYLNALAAGFQFDDFNVIIDNPAVHSLAAWWDGMPGIRPLLKLSYTLNWIADPGPAGFHAINILLHLANAALVWRLSDHFPGPADWSYERRTLARVVVTLLFALHPIQTESVTYASGRSMSLMALFALSSLLLWLEAPTTARRTLALPAFVAAILVKEVAVVLPLTLWLFKSGRRILLPALASALALVTLFGLFGYQRLLDETPVRDLGANLVSELNAIQYLLGQLFRPHALNIDPILPELTGWSWRTGIQATALLGTLACALAIRRRHPWLAFGVFWFVILLLPTHSLIARLDLASERHLYLAAIGPFWLSAVALSLLPGRHVSQVAVIILLLAGVAGTHLRNRDYRDEVSLWRQTVALSPTNARAWNNLGWAWHLAGDKPSATEAFRRALDADPDHRLARNNLDMLNADAAQTSDGTR